MEDFKDRRFTSVIKDPRFKKIPLKSKQTTYDRRIHGMLTGGHFQLNHRTDKRGSTLDHKIIKNYHQPDTDQLGKCPNLGKSSDKDGSTSSDTETETDDNDQEEQFDHHWQELDADAPRSENITRRLAVCNMDWDRLHAQDFLVVFNSFKPPNGVIHSVKIYPSEFGLQRMEKEKLHGPAELINQESDFTEDSTADEMTDLQFHQEKLRQYQINRLKYFFALVDCDSPQTADTLYEQLNGMEFESSGCILDLRFIPDDMNFEQEPISAANSISVPEDYQPSFFSTSALTQIKVELTWDQTDPRRKQVLEKAFADPESIEKDVKEYLASPSESDDETEELEGTTNSKKLSSKDAIVKYRKLLQTLEEKEKEQEEEFDMEITWDSGLKEKTEKLVKEKAVKEALTPFEEKLQKRKEVKKLKKERKIEPEKGDISSCEELELGDSKDDEFQKKVKSKGHRRIKFKSLENPEEEDGKKLAELTLLMTEPKENNTSDSDDMKNGRRKKNKENKGKMQKETNSEAFIDDPRFSAMYTSHLFHVDPAEQKFKERKVTQEFIIATQRKKYGDSGAAVSYEVSKKEADCNKSLKGKVCKSVKVEALKEKLTPFCEEFQKVKKSRKSKKERNGRLQKVSLIGQMSSRDGIVLKSTPTSGHLEPDEDSDILIFSRGHTVKRTSTLSSEIPHNINYVQKKMKKDHVS